MHRTRFLEDCLQLIIGITWRKIASRLGSVRNGANSSNSDGFDVSTCTNVVIRDSRVINQDDCVAVTSGSNVLVSGMYCDGELSPSSGSIRALTACRQSWSLHRLDRRQVQQRRRWCNLPEQSGPELAERSPDQDQLRDYWQCQ